MGGMSLIEPLDEKKLLQYTRQVYANSPYRDRLLDDAGVPRGNPVPTRIGQSSPIKHVIYIVKENRTYDQVFGDLAGGNGDPSLVLFTEDSSVNHRRLAREFGLFDNFYVNGDVSADGHNWSAGAISPDMTNKLWPNLYSGRRAAFQSLLGPPADQSHRGCFPTPRRLPLDAGVRGWDHRPQLRLDHEAAHGSQDRRGPGDRRREQTIARRHQSLLPRLRCRLPRCRPDAVLPSRP